MQGVTVKNVELNKVAVSDISGVARMIKMKNGKYHFEFSKQGYKTKVLIITVRKGKIERVEVVMEKEQ